MFEMEGANGFPDSPRWRGLDFLEPFCKGKLDWTPLIPKAGLLRGQKSREPPDRSTCAATPLPPERVISERAGLSTHGAGKAMPATTANLVVGGGDYGAPSADAARPKPSIRGSAVATAMKPRMQDLIIWKRRTTETLEGQQYQVHGEVRDQDRMEVSNPLEAVGPGAADELTGPAEPRQEQ